MTKRWNVTTWDENRLDLTEGVTQQVLLQLRRIKSLLLPSAVNQLQTINFF